MTTLHNTPEGFLSVTKGAPEILLANSTHYYENGSMHPMTSSKRKEFKETSEQFASQALRVLAAAFRKMPTAHKDNSLEKELVFVGLAGFMDPPRREAYAAVKSCKNAGIRPVMITGDHRATASAIGQELGICSHDSEVLTDRKSVV